MSKIVDHFEAKKDHLKGNLDCNETDLLKKLRFEKCCGLQKDTPNESGLFGYGSLKADYRSNGDSDIIIEVKYIRNSNGQHNECDIKNGLSQIIEQAVCKNVKHAILLIIDAGRARNRGWNDIERKFISMFQQNPFNINLKVIRIRILEDGEEIDIKTEIV